jgi:hypothetical protein
MRKGNCRRADQADQAEPLTNCVQKSQRIRCCGRVITQPEVGDQLLTNEQCQGRGLGWGQGMLKLPCLKEGDSWCQRFKHCNIKLL